MKINLSFSNQVGVQYLFLFTRTSILCLSVSTGFVPKIVGFLGNDRNPRLQRYAASAAIEIAYGTTDHVKVLIAYGAVPKLVRLIDSKSNFVRNEVIFALSNIVGDNKEFRDIVIRRGVLYKLSSVCSPELIIKPSGLPLLRLMAWTLSNIVRWKPIPHWKHTKITINMLSLMLNCKNWEILKDSCTALSCLCDEALGGNTKLHIQAIKSNGSLNRLVHLLDYEKSAVQLFALRACGSIVIGNHKQTQYLMDLHVLKPLHRLIKADEPAIAQHAVWTVANVTAGATDQIDAVIAAKLFPSLIEFMKTGTYKIAADAAWAIINVTSVGSKEQIKYLEEQGVIPALYAFSRRFPVIPEGRDMMDVVHEAIVNVVEAQNSKSGNEDEENTKVIKDHAAVIDALKQIIPKHKSECWQCAISMQGKKHFTCSDCQRPTYCGKRCQKRHWLRHRTDCTDQCHILQTLSNYSASLYSAISTFKHWNES